MILAMTTREKIIVGVMCLTIVYGAYELLSGGSRKPAPSAVPAAVNPTDDLRTLVADLSKNLIENPSDRPVAYLAGKAEDPWGKDPFIDSTAPLKKQLPQAASAQEEAVASAPALSFAFSGFLQMGATRMAIINGLEYAVGESLGTSGYVVRGITPKQVVIGKLNSSETIVVPLRDIDSEPVAPTRETWN
jgi:hypothetical protein